MFNEYPDILNVDDVQQALGIGRTMVYRLLKKGEIRHLRIGASLKIPKLYLIDFVQNSCYPDNVVEIPLSEEDVV
jgi:excisionase family DNA binding protein